MTYSMERSFSEAAPAEDEDAYRRESQFNVIHERMTAYDEHNMPVKMSIHRNALGNEGAPIIFGNGFSIGRQATADFARFVASEYARPMITFDHQRSDRRGQSPEDHKAETIRAVMTRGLNWLNQESGEAIAYSEGGINTSLYALEDQRREAGQLAKMTLLAPAGTIPTNFPRILARGGKEIGSLFHRREIQNARSLGKFARASGKYVVGNLILSVREGHSASTILNNDNLEELQENGLPIAMVGGTYDKFFPASELRQHRPLTVPFQELPMHHESILYDQAIQTAVYTFHERPADDTPLRVA